MKKIFTRSTRTAIVTRLRQHTETKSTQKEIRASVCRRAILLYRKAGARVMTEADVLRIPEEVRGHGLRSEKRRSSERTSFVGTERTTDGLPAWTEESLKNGRDAMACTVVIARTFLTSLWPLQQGRYSDVSADLAQWTPGE